MRVRFSFILEVEDSEGGLDRIQEIAEEVAAEFDCTLDDDERDQLACVAQVSEDATA
tara:strand:- start:101 stop:271 length:171 start_codon:yes stop_codon:yes gene_type:complete